jgi:hypothetical protein
MSGIVQPDQDRLYADGQKSRARMRRGDRRMGSQTHNGRSSAQVVSHTQMSTISTPTQYQAAGVL